MKDIESHVSDKPWSCKKCNFTADKQSVLAIHVLAKHTGCPTESSVPEMRSHTEKNCLACTTCGYNSTSSADLKRHMTTHKATEGYGMNNTSGQSIYNTHPDIGNSLVECPTLEEPTQTNEKRFACPSCTYKCSSIPNMKSHMASHKVTEVYICDEVDDCSFECDNMESLQKH